MSRVGDPNVPRAFSVISTVVVADVPPFAVFGGNPAKQIKARFSQETVLALEGIAWWDWPIEKISKHLAIIVSADVEALKACSDA